MNDVMTPEEYELLLSLGAQSAEVQAAIEQQLAQAERLRAQGQLPQGQMAGRLYVAPNILQYAAALANTKVAGDKERMAAEQRRSVLGNQNQQNQMVMRSILNSNRPNYMQPQPSQPEDPYARFRMGGNT